MSRLGNIKLRGLFWAGILWLSLAPWAFGSSLEEVKSRLQLARENLRISEATEARIASELEKLERSGKASPEVLKDYEAYLARAHEMVVENRKIVKEMEAVYAKLAPPRQSASSSTSAEKRDITDPKIPDEEQLDERATLEREFNASLAAFDEMLLKKWDEILARSAEEMSDLGEELGDKKGRSGEEAEEEEMSSIEGSPETQEEAEDRKTATESGRPESNGGDKGRPLTQKERERYSEYDDDIVARQLCEAAENETDPELREKLWKEYEDHKGKVETEENP